MEVRIDLNSTAVVRMFQRAPAILHQALRNATEDTVADVLLQMATYPTQRPPANPKHPYKRTNTLKASWLKRVKEQRLGWIGEVVSTGATAPYNIWVQKADTQARQHRGHWTNTDREVVARSEARVRSYYATELARAARLIALR